LAAQAQPSTWGWDGAAQNDSFEAVVSLACANTHAFTCVTDRNSDTTSYQYDTGGRLSKTTLANTAYTDYAYNNRDFVTSVTNKKSDATVISSYTYQYDSAGNPTKMTEANGDYTDYGYDNVYELTSEVMKDSGGTTIYSISWTYDNVGNRATQTKDGTQTSYTYNNMNQMTAAGSASFTYDSNGNTASKTESQATTNYTWHYENRLTKIDNPSGDDYVYEYDGDGMRARSGHDSGQGNVWDTRFYYDVGAPLYAYLFESDNDKTMTVAYTVGPSGNLISQRRSGSTYYHLYDRLGSTRKLLDSSQATTDSYSYYAFGEVRSSSGSTTNPFKFVGRLGYYDDPSTDFQYLRARYYAPVYGRFWSVDRAGEPQPGYVYAENQAVVARDPGGLHGFRACYQPCVDVCVAQGGNWYWCGLRCEAVCAFHRHRPRPALPPGVQQHCCQNLCHDGQPYFKSGNACQHCSEELANWFRSISGALGQAINTCEVLDAFWACGTGSGVGPTRQFLLDTWRDCLGRGARQEGLEAILDALVELGAC
jgi:RHS repeat-associated protein